MDVTPTGRAGPPFSSFTKAKRSQGSCPNCEYLYYNARKPQFCPTCNHELGGSFKPKPKKPRLEAPDCSVLLQEGDFALYSVKTSSRDDRCFVVCQGQSRLCHHEQCKQQRAVHMASSGTASTAFSCKHLMCTTQSVMPQESYCINADLIDEYPADSSIKQDLHKLLAELDGAPAVYKLSSRSYVVYGVTTATSPTKYTHVHLVEGLLKCRSRDCRNNRVTITKQVKSRNICKHLHMLLCLTRNTLVKDSPSTPVVMSSISSCPLTSETSVPSSSQTAVTSSVSTTTDAEQRCSVSRSKTIELNCKRSIPYPLPTRLAAICRSYDAATTLKLNGYYCWPSLFEPSDSDCQLCGAKLKPSRSKLGCTGEAFLLTNQHAFRAVQVKVKYCRNQCCQAMHQVWPLEYGLFNVNDKLLVSIEILIEWRELLKRGVPVQVFIGSKLEALCKLAGDSCDLKSAAQREYLVNLLYNGFYCFEALSNRSLDDVVCGICGIAGEVYCGDGNEKNCCSNDGVFRDLDPDISNTQGQQLQSLEDFLDYNKCHWIEASTYTKVELYNKVIAASSVPPIIAPCARGNQVFNTEMEKNSRYLKPTIEGDPAVLHQLIRNNSIRMDDLHSRTVEELKTFCSECKIPVTGIPTARLIKELRALHESLLVGNSPCHGFTKVNGSTGGFYHIVCRHGTTVASKSLLLRESVRDAADLYLSLKHPPPLFVTDTPCTFTRHMDLRVPNVTEKIWGSSAGCFETPTLGKEPQQVSIPFLVPLEFRPEGEHVELAQRVLEEWQHPITNDKRRFVVGDRFHTSTNPHKSPLCSYHDIELLEQCNTIKTSLQEGENNRKQFHRLRSSTMQKFRTHFFSNYLMDFYHNEKILEKLKEHMDKTMGQHEELVRGPYHRLVKVRKM